MSSDHEENAGEDKRGSSNHGPNGSPFLWLQELRGN
jgi:hypothetical protein